MPDPTYNSVGRFAGLASLYDRHRPDYSRPAIEFILARCGLAPEKRLADVGCGTGIATRAFAAAGLEVIGIEPNAEMRRQAESLPLQPPIAPVYRDGRAEATGLPDAWADAVVAAQAFHWFDPNTALPEFIRILRPGGWIVLMWNEPDISDPFAASYVRLLAEHSPEPVFAKRGPAMCP